MSGDQGRHLISTSSQYMQVYTHAHASLSQAHKRKLNTIPNAVILKTLFILESILLKNSQEATAIWSRRDDLPRYIL